MKKIAVKNLLIVCMLLLSSLAQAMEVPKSLQEVSGILKNDERVFTSSLPAKEDYNNIAKAGVEIVINLMPNSQNIDYNNEAELVKKAGMKYIYLPVDWNNPTMENIDQFFAAMKNYKDKKLLIHCFSNFRASAFYYIYLKNQTESDVDMSIIMSPWGDDVVKRLNDFPKWKKLIDDAEKKYKM